MTSRYQDTTKIVIFYKEYYIYLASCARLSCDCLKVKRKALKKLVHRLEAHYLSLQWFLKHWSWGDILDQNSISMKQGNRCISSTHYYFLCICALFTRVSDLLYFGSNQYLSPSKGSKEKRVIKVEKTSVSSLRLYRHLGYVHVGRRVITLLV